MLQNLTRLLSVFAAGLALVCAALWSRHITGVSPPIDMKNA